MESYIMLGKRSFCLTSSAKQYSKVFYMVLLNRFCSIISSPRSMRNSSSDFREHSRSSQPELCALINSQMFLN